MDETKKVENYVHLFRNHSKSLAHSAQIDVVELDEKDKERGLAIVQLKSGHRTAYLHAFYPDGLGSNRYDPVRSSLLFQNVVLSFGDPRIREHMPFCGIDQIVAFAPGKQEHEALEALGFSAQEKKPHYLLKRI